ncbi:hypothetical protein BDZ89DRAFT_1057561 [Hymenopellis radicata]|nr:hypothetical protein BDZ89DRAFT_1057561 [Hymenopellis radicata]
MDKHFPLTASLLLTRKIFGKRMYREVIRDWRLLLLNWLSYCLVRNRTEQSVAAGLTVHPDTQEASFLLSTNIPLEPTLLFYYDNFFSTLQAIFHDQIERHRNQCLPEDENDDADDVRRITAVVVAGASARIHHKLELVPAAGEWSRSGDSRATLSRLVTHWITQRAQSLGPPNCDLQSLMTAYDTVISLTPSMLLEDVQSRVDAFTTITISIRILLRSSFMSEMRKPSAVKAFKLSLRDEYFILKLRRRLWRVVFYTLGANHIFRRRFRKQLFWHGWKIKYVCLPFQATGVLTLHVAPYPYTTSVIVNRGVLVTAITRDDFDASYKSVLKDLWQAGDTATLRVHPEMQIMHALASFGIDVGGDAGTVGCSKRSCLMCYWALENGLKKCGYPFTITAPSKKVVTDWLMPALGQAEENAALVKGAKHFIVHTANALVEQYRDVTGEAFW